jgi:hypothetical protein
MIRKPRRHRRGPLPLLESLPRAGGHSEAVVGPAGVIGTAHQIHPGGQRPVPAGDRPAAAPPTCRRVGTSRTAYPTGGVTERARAHRLMTSEGHQSGNRVLRNLGDETGVDVQSGPDASALQTFPTRFADR